MDRALKDLVVALAAVVAPVDVPDRHADLRILDHLMAPVE
jgi:hypothetical protein